MKIILLCLGLVSFANFAHASGDSECAQFWQNIEKANTHFEKTGDAASAKELIKVLPEKKKQTPFDCKEQNATIDSLLTNKKSRQALLKKEPDLAYPLYFRLRYLAGGAFAEGLDADLADSMVATPELFLKNLRTFVGEIYCPRELVRAIGSIGLKEDVQNAKIKERADALKKVKNDDLEDLQHDCLKQLKAID